MLFWQLTLYTLSAGMFFSVLSMGFGFTLRTQKFFNLSYGGAFLMGGYMMFLFYRELTLPFLISLLLSLLCSGLYLALAYKFIFRVLLSRKARNLVLLIASFGLLASTSALLGMIFGNQTSIAARNLSQVGAFDILGGTLNTIQVLFILLVPILVFILAYIRYKTRFGRSVRAIEDDMEVAELVGIPKEKTMLIVFFASGALAGTAGVAESFDVGIMPAGGLMYLLPTIVAAVVGGIRSFWGGILGAFVLALAQKITVVLFGGTWVSAVPFVILIIALLIRPEGILKR